MRKAKMGSLAKATLGQGGRPCKKPMGYLQCAQGVTKVWAAANGRFTLTIGRILTMLRRVSSLVFLVSLALASATGDAQAAGRLAAARAARTVATQTAVTTASLKTTQRTQPVAAVSPAVCCPQPCLTYRHRGHHRACCGCAPPVETVLTACDPCTCCPVAIPVCVPACCQGEPSVSCHHGLLCASVVDFDWACGYRVTVRFKHNGQVVVVTRG